MEKRTVPSVWRSWKKNGNSERRKLTVGIMRSAIRNMKSSITLSHGSSWAPSGFRSISSVCSAASPLLRLIISSRYKRPKAGRGGLIGTTHDQPVTNAMINAISDFSARNGERGRVVKKVLEFASYNGAKVLFVQKTPRWNLYKGAEIAIKSPFRTLNFHNWYFMEVDKFLILLILNSWIRTCFFVHQRWNFL